MLSLQLRQIYRPHIWSARRRGRFVAPIRLSASASEEVSNGGNRYTISIKKPLGLVLEQSFGSNMILVESVVEGGNAYSTGQVQEGDRLIGTSGVIYTSEKTYGDTKVKGGQQIVRMNVTNESFDAVLAAIGSHPGHIPVEMEFERTEQNNKEEVE